MQIEHNPHEKRPTNAVYWVLGTALLFSWSCYFYFRDPDWWPLALGWLSGMVLATWAIEITGDKVPDSWRGKPASARRPTASQEHVDERPTRITR